MSDIPSTPDAGAAPAAPPTPEAAPAQHPWAELPPDRFRLLRLAPLTTDRDTGPRPLRFVELAQLERHSAQQSLLRLQIRLPGELHSKKTNLIEIWADHRAKELRFGPDSGLRIEPVNRGLGRFLLAQGIAWAQRRWSHYLVEGGTLAKDTGDERMRLHRDHWLQTQGFELNYPASQNKATYAAPRVSVLRPDWNQDKVQIIDLQDAAAMLEQADRKLLTQENEILQLQQRMSRLRREDGSLRFTIACLVAFALFQAGILIWIATR